MSAHTSSTAACDTTELKQAILDAAQLQLEKVVRKLELDKEIYTLTTSKDKAVYIRTLKETIAARQNKLARQEKDCIEAKKELDEAEISYSEIVAAVEASKTDITKHETQLEVVGHKDAPTQYGVLVDRGKTAKTVLDIIVRYAETTEKDRIADAVRAIQQATVDFGPRGTDEPLKDSFYKSIFEEIPTDHPNSITLFVRGWGNLNYGPFQVQVCVPCTAAKFAHAVTEQHHTTLFRNGKRDGTNDGNNNKHSIKVILKGREVDWVPQSVIKHAFVDVVLRD